MGRLKALTSRLKPLPQRVAPLRASADRIRGRELQSIRAAHFRDNPLCVECAKRDVVRYATELDHIVALCNGGQDVPSNRQGLCHECHEAKTARDVAEAGGRK